MAPEAKDTVYTRLPGRGRRLSARFVSGEGQRLYLNGNQLIVVRRVGYEESSKRYSLGDIQAITMQSNADRTIVSATLMLTMMLIAGLGLVLITQEVGPTEFAMILLYVLAGILAAFLAANFAMGPTCTIRLHTAVQIEDLTALRRLRAARKCLAILLPRIEALQGAPPTLPELPVRASARVRQIRGAKHAPKAISRTLHASAFALSVAFGMSLVAELIYESAAKDLIDTLLMASSMLLLLIAAIRQTNTTLPSQTRSLTWILFVLNGIAYMGTMYLFIFLTAFDAAASGEGPPDMITGTIKFGQEDPRWVDTIVAVWGVIGAVIALFGLLSIRGYQVVERGSSGEQGVPPS